VVASQRQRAKAKALAAAAEAAEAKERQRTAAAAQAERGRRAACKGFMTRSAFMDEQVVEEMSGRLSGTRFSSVRSVPRPINLYPLATQRWALLRAN
jgi:Flp pilus assembly protein TadG